MSKKLLAAVLALSLVMSLLFVPAAAATTFDDVAEDHWAASSIEKWAGYGVLTGHGDGTFTPDVAMTRAEFAAMLVKMLGLTAKSETKFTDVTDDHWAAEVISIAVKAGIINGVGDNKFDPDIPVSFEEAAVMMCRAFGLAKNTSGTDWSKESIEKLTSLGMIGEGADEHLQVGVECNRAVVAKLADTMVAEYVAEDRATPITGEVKGVVLVVKGAKAEIKDATLAAPVVAESASVTLTNTKADAVIVSGKDAAVTADEQSTVASVVLAGEAPKADIKGEVASVTVAEETTGAVIDAPKAADNAIVNNSGTDITVNGETVSNKTDDEPSTPSDDTTAGESAEDHSHTFTYTKIAEETDPWKHTKACSEKATCKFADVRETCTKVYVSTATGHKQKCANNCGWVDAEETAHTFVNGVCSACGYKVTIDESGNEGNTKIPSNHVHHWVEDSDNDVDASCTTVGKKVFKCDGSGGEGDTAWTCAATRMDDVAALGHDFSAGAAVVDGSRVEPTCTTAGSQTVTCKRDGCNATEKQTLAIVPTAHNITGVNTWMKSETQHWKVCNLNGQHRASLANHTWGEDDQANVCTVCGAAKPTAATCSKKSEHSNIMVGATCPVCGFAGTKKYAPANCPDKDTTHGTLKVDETCPKCGAAGTAKYEAANCPDKEGHSNIMVGQTCPKCDTTGTKKYDPSACPDKDVATHGDTECPKCGYTKPANLG